MELPLPTDHRFGPYRLSARIATGGMAEVYAARRLGPDGRPGSMVALKRLLPHLARDPLVVQMFLNEARITAQVQHPNVVRIVDLGHHEGEPFIAMELLEGHSFAVLRERAAHLGERVPLGITLKVLTDACRGLDAAHRAVDEDGRPLCIVHRDFTPDNVHVGVDGRVTVIDFGVAKATNLGAGTEPGTLKGKFFYMSPEMITGQTVDHRADVFAAGVMLYEQLCGRRPFTGLSTNEVLDRIAEGRPRRPTEFDPSVPPALEEICLRALSPSPDDRFQSLRELVQALEAIGAAAQPASSAQTAAYVGRLFPAESDPLRQQLNLVRQRDPSDPGNSAAPPEQPLEIAAPPPAARRRGRRWWPCVGAALLVIGALAGARSLLLKPEVPPAGRLAHAVELSDRHARAKALSGIGRDDRSGPEELSRAGELLLEVSAHPEALELAESFRARFPERIEPHLLEAEAAIGLRHGRRAEAAIDRARRLAPHSAEPELLLARLRELQGDLSGAAAALGEALKKAPGSERVAARQGFLLSQGGRLPEAEAVLSKLLARTFDPEAAAELAFVRYRQGRPQEALPLLRRALERKPQLARAHYYLGAVQFQQGEMAAAERAYLEAERLWGDDPRPLVALCQLYTHRRRMAEVEDVQERLRTRFPGQASALIAQCGGVQ